MDYVQHLSTLSLEELQRLLKQVDEAEKELDETYKHDKALMNGQRESLHDAIVNVKLIDTDTDTNEDNEDVLVYDDNDLQVFITAMFD